MIADWRLGYLQYDTITWFRGMCERKASTTKDTKVHKGIQSATVTRGRLCSTMRQHRSHKSLVPGRTRRSKQRVRSDAASTNAEILRSPQDDSIHVTTAPRGSIVTEVEKSKMNSGLVRRLNPKSKLLDQAAHFDVFPEQVGLH